MRSRKLLALLFCLITFPAIAGYMTLLGAGVGSIAPVVSWVSGTDAFPSTLSFSRTSNATMFDSTGKLTYAPNNLLTQSNTFNTGWSLGSVTLSSGVSDPIGGSNAWTATATGAGAQVTQSASVGSGNFITAYWVRRRTGSGTISIYSPNAVTPNAISVTGSWQQFYVVGASSGTAYAKIVISNSGDAIDIYAATLSAVTYETTPRTADQVITTAAAYYGPRIDYDPNTLAVKGLLIEEARTNSVINNADPATWAVIGAANTTGVADPQSLTKAATVTAAAGAGYHYTSQTGATASAAQARVVSVFVKQGTAPYVNFGASGDASWHVGWMKWSDLSTGSTNGTVSVQALAGGYYRLSLAFTMTSAVPVLPYVGPDTASRATGPNYTAAGTETVVAWGLQDEPGTASTSLIITGAGAVTRAADVVQFTGAALAALQGSAGSAIVETTDSRNTSAVLIGANTLSDYRLFWDSSAAKNYNGTYLISGAANPANPARAALAWSAAGRSIVANGGTVSTDGTPIVQGAAPFYLGAYGGSLYNPNAHFKSFAIYNQRLPDATLQAKSVVGASYAANDNGLRFADNDNLPIHWRVAL